MHYSLKELHNPHKSHSIKAKLSTVCTTKMILPKEKRSIHPTIMSVDKISIVSRLLRILIKSHIFPLKADFEKRQLSFSFCSMPTFFYSLYSVIILFLSQTGQGKFSTLLEKSYLSLPTEVVGI